MDISLILNIAVFILLILLLLQMRKTQWSLSKKVFSGLCLGVLFGLGLHWIYGPESAVLQQSIQWFNIVGSGYVKLLQMVVMPLVFVSILSAVIKLHNASSLGKISIYSISTLLFTTAIAALVGIGVTNLFGLSAEGLVQGNQESSRLDQIHSDYIGKVSDLSVPDFILSFIPQNPFAELTGAHANSIISVVIFSVFLGIAGLKLIQADTEKGQHIITAVNTLQAWVMHLVRLVMALTPYGVFALITKVVASSKLIDMINLGGFLVASYLGLGIMFVVHAVILVLSGVNPIRFFKKAIPVLTFAALIVLPMMGLPVTLVALLISIEPLIDMGRTALNVSGSMTAGMVTSQWMQQTDTAVLNADQEQSVA